MYIFFFAGVKDLLKSISIHFQTILGCYRVGPWRVKKGHVRLNISPYRVVSITTSSLHCSVASMKLESIENSKLLHSFSTLIISRVSSINTTFFPLLLATLACPLGFLIFKISHTTAGSTISFPASLTCSLFC